MKNICFLFMLALLSCGGSKKISNKADEQILFGNGGGFTGAEISYSLSLNGELNKIGIGKDKNTSLKMLHKKTTERIFEKAKALKDYHYNTPDNMNCFIEIKSKELNEKYVWGINSTQIDSRVKQLYDELMSYTK